MTLSVESAVDDGVGGQDPSTALVASFDPKVARRRAVRAHVVGDQSETKPYFLRSLRISFSVACLFRLDCASTSRTSPSSGGRAQFDSEIDDLMQTFDDMQALRFRMWDFPVWQRPRLHTIWNQISIAVDIARRPSQSGRRQPIFRPINADRPVRHSD
jgi:hypothetical protein